MIVIMSTLGNQIYLISSTFLLKNKTNLPSDCFILERHVWVIISIILDIDLYILNASEPFSDNYLMIEASDNPMCGLI